MIETIEVTRLNEAPYNPRVRLEPGMLDYEHLKRSIETFGNVEPIVWNQRTGNVVGGHQRLVVLKDLGYTEVPCNVIDISEKDEKVLNLALNKIKGEWDYTKLEEMLSGFEMDVATLSGFSADELALFLGRNELGIDEDNFASWEEDEDNILGSYVITLRFASCEDAAAWAAREGYPGKVKKGTKTTVIRVE